PAVDARLRAGRSGLNGRRAVPDPTPLDGAHLFEFVRESELAVMFVSVHRLHTFNGALSQRLGSEHKAIAIGSIDLGALLQQGPRLCEPPAMFGVLPGYYLFRNGEMLAWDAGVPVFADFAALGRSALLGAVFSGVSHDLTLIVHALHVAADQVAAERMAWLF